MAEKQYIWSEDDKVVDVTKKVKKLWDEIIPEIFNYVLKFDTEGVKWVDHTERLGPYQLTRKKLKFSVNATISIKPLMDTGWTEEDGQITLEKFKEAYGEDYDYNLRSLMREILPHVAINVSHFDFEGDLTYDLI